MWFWKLGELILQMANADDLDNDLDTLLATYEHKWNRTLLHSVAFY